MKTLMTWIITIGVFLLGVIAVLAVSSPAEASGSCRTHGGCERGSDVRIEYRYLQKDDDRWKYIAGGAVVGTCLLWPATKSYIWPLIRTIWTWRRPEWRPWVNCWDDPTKDEPFPDPGPAVITPSSVSVEVMK